MTSPTLVILAAGRARRYGSIKPLAPVGPAGETILDLLADDAYAAGFGHLVIVVNPDTGPIIQDHVARHWPSNAKVSFATQHVADGTVMAILAAQPFVDATQPFGVANADDLYGRAAMFDLGHALASLQGSCLVGFHLDNSLVGDDPVSRGVCEVRDGRLVSVRERRQVRRKLGGFVVGDGQKPSVLNGDTVVSVNLWGFDPSVWKLLEDARDASEHSEDNELLLPEIVGQHVRAGDLSVSVTISSSRCVGVTHPGDLELVQADIAGQIKSGERPAVTFVRTEELAGS
jgi:dTDP-glucose pyrophosphorylase